MHSISYRHGVHFYQQSVAQRVHCAALHYQAVETNDPNAQVREYFSTPEGKALLIQGYRTENIRDYVMKIEPTGFLLGILEKIDARS